MILEAMQGGGMPDFGVGGVTKIFPGKSFLGANPSGGGAREALKLKFGKPEVPKAANKSKRGVGRFVKDVIDSGRSKPSGGERVVSSERLKAGADMAEREMREIQMDLVREIDKLRPRQFKSDRQKFREARIGQERQAADVRTELSAYNRLINRLQTEEMSEATRREQIKLANSLKRRLTEAGVFERTK
jgi:hypothetical protein